MSDVSTMPRLKARYNDEIAAIAGIEAAGFAADPG